MDRVLTFEEMLHAIMNERAVSIMIETPKRVIRVTENPSGRIMAAEMGGDSDGLQAAGDPEARDMPDVRKA